MFGRVEFSEHEPSKQLQTLDAEIALFRKMLEGEENRAGLKQLVEQVVKTHAISQETDTGEQS